MKGNLDVYWAQLFADHVELMRRAASKVIVGDHRGGDPTAAGLSVDDVVHTVFVELIADGKPLDAPNIGAFLYRRTRDRAKDCIKTGGHSWPIPGADEVLDGEDRLQRPLEETVLDDLDAVIVAGALEQLPARERLALDQRIRRGRMASEVAADLGVTPQRVSQLINQGLRRLRADESFIESVSIGHPEMADHDHEGRAT